MWDMEYFTRTGGLNTVILIRRTSWAHLMAKVLILVHWERGRYFLGQVLFIFIDYQREKIQAVMHPCLSFKGYLWVISWEHVHEFLAPCDSIIRLMSNVRNQPFPAPTNIELISFCRGSPKHICDVSVFLVGSFSLQPWAFSWSTRWLTILNILVDRVR